MSQSALQREERFIHGLVHWAADRLGQTKHPSLARARGRRLFFSFRHKGILLPFRSGCNGYLYSFYCSSTHSYFSSQSLEQRRKLLRKVK